jgi:L-alanine-DL-glutamate epimerase-like enolase superfamily enzyme
MNLRFWTTELKMAHAWKIARGLDAPGATTTVTALVELSDSDGVSGLGESSPTSRYKESVASSLTFFARIDAGQLSFDDVEGSMAYLQELASGDHAAKSAINVALLDGAARKRGVPVHDFLGLAFQENKHFTSFTIGIDSSQVIHHKVVAASQYPVLKLKLGSPEDKANLLALREAAPEKRVRVDANEGWKTKEQALEMIEWLATDGFVEFVEQALPSNTPASDLKWLKERSPLPLFADESFHTAADVEHCADCFHGVNGKLCKTGGLTNAVEALRAARAAGLKTMFGCMIETSILITAAAHLAELCDYLDLDGNILITNDPYLGVTAENGVLSFRNTLISNGLRVSKRS